MTLETKYLNKRFIIPAVILFYVICLALTFRLHMDERITSMLPEGDPQVSDFNYILENIPATEMLYIDIENLDDKKGESSYLEAADEVALALKQSPFFTDVVYRFSNDGFMNLLDLMNQKKFALFSNDDIEKIGKSLTTKGIDEHIRGVKRKLMDPSGFLMTEQLIKDPLGFNDSILTRLDALKNETSGIKIDGGRIMSQNENHILIMATPSFPAVDTVKSSDMINFLKNLKNKIDQEFKGNAGVGFSGNHIATFDNSTAIQKDVQRTVIILSAGILLIGFLFFRKKIYMFLIFLPTLISLTFASAFISFINTSVSAIALGCGAVLVGITVDFGIHILYSADNCNEPLEQILKKLKKPVATGALTTITAFSCLLFSSLPGQRQMGLFSMLGVAGAALFSLFLLKFFIPERTEDNRKPILSLVSFCNKLLRFRKKHLNVILTLCLMVLIISLFGLKNFTFSGDIENLNHLSPAVQKDLDTFLETWGGSSRSLVLVRGKNLESALEQNDRLSVLLSGMETKSKIQKITTLSSILPSMKTQKKNLQNWQNFMTRDRHDKLTKRVKEASLTFGFSENAFDPFFKTLEQEKTVIARDDYRETALDGLFKGKIIFKDDHVMVLTSFIITERSEVTAVMKEIKEHIPGTLFLDRKNFVRNITGLIADQFSMLLVFAALGMIISLSLFMRKLNIVLITVIPVFLSIIITAGILGLAGIPVNLISMLFVIFVFGVGVDFSIFLVNNELSILKQGGDRERSITSGAVIICAMTTTGGFISLAFAGHKALNSIGTTGLTGMVTSLVMALVLIPTLTEKLAALQTERDT